MLVVSFLVHAAVIYLIPSVDLLPQPSFQYFEIETVAIESEEQDVVPEDEQASEQQTAQQPEGREPVWESVTPLSDYEPFAPDMVSEGREQLHAQLLIPQQHFTLPETLENVNAVISPQKPAIQTDLAAVDMAFVSARVFAKTAPEASVPTAYHVQESTKDVVVIAEQPYERPVQQSESVAIQEMLPDLKKSHESEVIAQIHVPSFSTESIMKRTTGSDASDPVRPALPDIHVAPERPPLRFPEEKSLPQEQVLSSIPFDIETSAETSAASIPAETEPEFRPAQAVVLPTSHSQDVIAVSDLVLKPVHSPALVMENPPLPLATQHAYVRSEERLADIKALPAITHDQIIRYAKGIDRPDSSETSPSETMPEFRDNEFPQISKPVMAQTIDAPEHTPPVLLAKSPQKTEAHAENIEQQFVALRQKKSPVQEESPLQKLLPSFQTFSSLPAIEVAAEQSQQDRTIVFDQEDMFVAMPRPQLPDVAPIEAHRQPSSAIVVSVPRTRQALIPQNILASAAIVPFISSEKILTASEDTFEVKKMAQDVQPPEVEIARQSLSAEQQTREPEPETLQRPQKLKSRPESAFAAVSEQSPSFKPKPRSFVFGADTSAAVLPAHPVSFGMFVRKDAPASDAVSPQKTIRLDDALQQIQIDAPEEGPASLVIEGPASTRQVISKPLRLPEIDLDVEVTIRLQFWVLPDGSVGEVVPLQRGDIRLERAAIQYLKNWRFTPLSSGDQTVWGILPITYKLR